MKILKIFKKHKYILEKLASVTVAKRKKMLLSAPSQLFNVFKNLCKMVTEGHLSLGKAKKHMKLAAKIGKSKAGAIKGLVTQHGGAIGAILAGVLPFLTPLISKIFK